MRWVLILAMFFSTLALADERKLNGAEITALLPDIIAIGETTRQTFESSGLTHYDDGRRPTVGRWRVQGDSYCSTWPPGDGWRCYGVRVDERADNQPDLIIWVDTDLGDRTINTILPKGQ